MFDITNAGAMPAALGGLLMLRRRWLLTLILLAALAASGTRAEDKSASEGFVPLFNGTDLAGWKIPQGDNGHWIPPARSDVS